MKVKQYKEKLNKKLNENISDEINNDESSSLPDETQEITNDSVSDITPIENSAPKTSGNILIINGCEHDSPVYKKTEEFKKKMGCECKEIHLYQLNIQTPKKQEPKDGMMQVYDEIEKADAIIIACQAVKGKLSDILENTLDRIKNYYKKGELKNKVFGSIIIGNEDKIKTDLVLTALNDLGMVVCADCLFFSNDKSSSNISSLVDSISSLANATASIRNSVQSTDNIIEDDKLVPSNNIKGFGDYIDTKDEESDEDELFDDEESNEDEDEFLNDLKKNSNLNDTNEIESDETPVEEEEDKLIDNQDGTITQITKGEKIKESLSFDIIPFDVFFK